MARLPRARGVFVDGENPSILPEQRAGLCGARDREAYAADPLSRAASSRGDHSRTRMRRRRRFRGNAGPRVRCLPDRRIAGNGREASRRLGRPVETLLFHDLDKVEAYDGVWANACLLHVPRPELAQVLARIWRALKPGGISTPASRPARPTGATRSTATTIIHRRIGCAPTTPMRAAGVQCRSRPAKSEASTTNGRDAVRRGPEKHLSSCPGRSAHAAPRPGHELKRS